jgi:choline monooxygenase
MTETIETLPAGWYTDPYVYARERRLIFARNWSVLARADQVANPGCYSAGYVAGWPVFVVRDSVGVLRGFHNFCRHRAGPVISGSSGHCDLLRCPYHGWTYGLDGAPQKTPGFVRDAAVNPAAMSLLPIAVQIWNGIVFVCLQDRGIDLEQWLGEIVLLAHAFPQVDDMVFHSEVVSEGEVNWKSYGDNSAEGYHLGSVHPELTRALLTERTKISVYENGRFIAFNVVYKETENRAKSNGLWIYKFPGLLLHFSEYGFNLERVTPLGAERTRMQRWFWFPDSTPGAECDDVVAASNKVMSEDLAICIRVQENLAAGTYRTGQMSPSREAGTIFFQRCVREVLES